MNNLKLFKVEFNYMIDEHWNPKAEVYTFAKNHMEAMANVERRFNNNTAKHKNITAQEVDITEELVIFGRV